MIIVTGKELTTEIQCPFLSKALHSQAYELNSKFCKKLEA